MFFKLRTKLIRLIACGDPVIMNCHITLSALKDGYAVIYFPCNSQKYNENALLQPKIDIK